VTDRSLRVALAGVAGLGVVIAAYLTVVHAQGGVPICVSGGCETVQRSRYAELAGLPVAALGLALYASLLCSAATRRRLVVAAAAALASAAVAFAAYLVYIQLDVLHAVCTWCLASDVLTAVAAMIAWLRLYRHLG
jgi:uncharacterized membrane protein